MQCLRASRLSHGPAARETARRPAIAGLQSTQVPHRVWARPRHAVQCDATAIEHLYDPNSTYHQSMTSADLPRFLPTAEAAAAVETQLQDNGLISLEDDPLYMSVCAEGTVDAVQRAFHTSPSFK
jgi:hypothetical protein